MAMKTGKSGGMRETNVVRLLFIASESSIVMNKRTTK
jgi:hypothetical protein